MQAASAPSTSEGAAAQGVFVLRHEGGKLKARFVPVRTGITGSTDIEVTGGLGPEDEVVIGSYATLRTLKNGSQGQARQRDRCAPASRDESS